MSTSEPLFVGTSNRVHAIDRATGAILWHRELDTRFFKFGNNFVNLYFDGSSLFAATFAKVYCLDPVDGSVRWEARLEGSALNPTTFASSASFNAEAAWNKFRTDRS
jgi:outer membrane protein assembly factor BamB